MTGYKALHPQKLNVWMIFSIVFWRGLELLTVNLSKTFFESGILHNSTQLVSSIVNFLPDFFQHLRRWPINASADVTLARLDVQIVAGAVRLFAANGKVRSHMDLVRVLVGTEPDVSVLSEDAILRLKVSHTWFQFAHLLQQIGHYSLTMGPCRLILNPIGIHPIFVVINF